MGSHSLRANTLFDISICLNLGLFNYALSRNSKFLFFCLTLLSLQETLNKYLWEAYKMSRELCCICLAPPSSSHEK